MAPIPPQAHQLMEQMNDIIAPPPVGWWPPAPGWWVLALLLIALLAWGIYSWRLRRQRNVYRHAALVVLESLQNCSDETLPTEINRLLKRTALSAYPNYTFSINRAFGDSWVRWLNRCCKTPVLNGEAALTLAVGSYQPDITCPREELTAVARRWIESHKLNAKPGEADV